MPTIQANLRPALIIAWREIRDQLRDWRIIFPVVGLTVFFPFLMNFTASQAMSFVQKYGANIIGERLVPFLLMIVGFFPISVSLVIALEFLRWRKRTGKHRAAAEYALERLAIVPGQTDLIYGSPLAFQFPGYDRLYRGPLLARYALA